MNDSAASKVVVMTKTKSKATPALSSKKQKAIARYLDALENIRRTVRTKSQVGTWIKGNVDVADLESVAGEAPPGTMYRWPDDLQPRFRYGCAILLTWFIQTRFNADISEKYVRSVLAVVRKRHRDVLIRQLL